MQCTGKSAEKNGLILFGRHGLTWGLGLWLAVNSMMLGGSVQIWYDESIPLEEMYSADMQSSWFKSLCHIALRKKKLPLPSLSHALQHC